MKRLKEYLHATKTMTNFEWIAINVIILILATNIKELVNG